MVIAMGIGLRNFSEGVAIGQSAASGEISLALLLISGFGLPNATAGFGIGAPLPTRQTAGLNERARGRWRLRFRSRRDREKATERDDKPSEPGRTCASH